MSDGAPTSPRTDDEIVEKLRDMDYRSGWLQAALAVARDGMAWAASNLPPPSRERQLLEKRIQETDRKLALVARADAPAIERAAGEDRG